MPAAKEANTQRGFKRSACAQPAALHAPKIPKAAEIREGPAWSKPPEAVASHIDCGGQWLIGIDIETHHWEISRGNKLSIGQFGFYNLCTPRDLESRICQLGWAYGPPGRRATVKERLVRPVDFRISEDATNYHGISHEQAQDGEPIADVLAEFLGDLRYVVEERGGRMVCHNMEFDCGIIKNEMDRCASLGDAGAKFHSIAGAGFCTMDPRVGRWLKQCWGEDCGGAGTMNVLALKAIAEKLLTEDERGSLLEKHHTAGADAHLHRKVAYAFAGLSRAPCRMPLGQHKLTEPDPSDEAAVRECEECHERF